MLARTAALVLARAAVAVVLVAVAPAGARRAFAARAATRGRRLATRAVACVQDSLRGVCACPRRDRHDSRRARNVSRPAGREQRVPDLRLGALLYGDGQSTDAVGGVGGVAQAARATVDVRSAPSRRRRGWRGAPSSRREERPRRSRLRATRARLPPSAAASPADKPPRANKPVAEPAARGTSTARIGAAPPWRRRACGHERRSRRGKSPCRGRGRPTARRGRRSPSRRSRR